MATQTSIPISQVVSVSPSAINVAGGVDFIKGLIVTQNTAVAADGAIVAYTNAADVAAAAGSTSVEAQMATAYFGSFTGATQTPSTLYFAGKGSSDSQAFGDYLSALIAQSQDFAGITFAFEPAIADKQAIATWNAAQNKRFWIVIWDTDVQAVVLNSAEAFGTWLASGAYDGVSALYQDPVFAAAALGWMASLNFDTENGRWNLFGRQFPSVTASVTTGAAASSLQANGYSFYGLHANGLGRFTFTRGGMVSGQFKWADSYINQIWMNASFQSDMLNLLLTAGNIPFNTQGDALVSAGAQPTIDQALAFGAIRAGVTLTAAEILEVNNAAGIEIASTLQTRGWYFKPNASTAAASVRGTRGTIQPQFWYTDGESVQSINLASIEVQ
ncbi:MAG: DUF3383 family protein [Gluconobacter sp.]|uniref:DUF3383 family protein n=1 Tax=Gluconobacter sp. TaxID=1876758 RepID=UPI0039EC3163